MQKNRNKIKSMSLLNAKPKWLSPVPGGGGSKKPGHGWMQRAQEPLCQGHGEVLQSQNSNLLQSLLWSVPLRAPPLQPGSALKRKIVAFKELIFKACCPLELEWVSILLVSNMRKCRKKLVFHGRAATVGRVPLSRLRTAPGCSRMHPRLMFIPTMSL